MNQSPIEQPPTFSASQATPPAVVGLHLGDAMLNPFLADIVPMNIHLAAWMAARVLTLQLKQDALLEAEAVTICGTLADGVALIETRDARQTVAVLRAELEKLTLLPIAQIGVLEPGGWRCVHPGPEVNMKPLMDVDRIAVEIKRHAAALQARVSMFQKLMNRPPGAGPADAPAK